MSDQTTALEKPRILIVDDEKANLKILSELLSSEAEVSVAKSATQGLWKAEKLLPDLILLDVVMPEIDGFEALRRLKGHPMLSDIPVIFITGLDTADNEKYGLDLGALDYIRKPFNAAVVKTRIATHLKLIKQTKTLKALSVKLKESDDAKSRFLANMSHEIRTPLTAIIGYAELIQQNELSDMDSHQAINIIESSGKHLLNLINDILDLSKIEAEKLQLEIMQVGLPGMLDEILALVTPKADEKDLDFMFQIQYPIPSHISTDPTRLKQVLINLINNAIKFTEQGAVRLIVAVREEVLSFNVVDTGIGIDEQQQKHIFSAFEQADASVARQFGGTGLGLNISKYLTQKLGGDLTVTSLPRLGSDFQATIALSPGKDARTLENEQDYAEALLGEKAQKSHNAALSGHILLAEDQPDLRVLIAMMITKLGLQVTAVENGKQLLEKVRQEPFDLILSDIHMPELNGEQAIASLVDMDIKIPAIALTANAMKHEVIHYLNQGFTDHLSKPIEQDEFYQKLALYLSKGGVGSSALALSASEKLRLIELFKQGLPERMTVLDSFASQANWAGIKQIVFSLKGAVAALGFDKLGELLTEIDGMLLQTQYLQEPDGVLQRLAELQRRAEVIR